ncbi:hypothetical protein [Neisseria dumasiana]|uniref:Uncharacterized protein n=1 Tax=Neisseria dumasiana TaxID=1931275 RepID=A0A1X3DHD3_9NEIS|nr:hypothetical protein [Neisseria dumasiana]OSI20402.1 hypothetical protein BV912_07475 [Neisseria dumasiana]
MNKVTKISISTVKARIGSCDDRAVIAETENGKLYCLFHMGIAHGFNRIADGYKDDVGRDINSFEKAFEVQKLVSRKGREYYQAKHSQY